MTAAPHNIDPQEFLHEHLAQASPDLLRDLMQMFINIWRQVWSNNPNVISKVTPASAGIYYTDTAGTLGAWRWISTGTTNTSWLVIAGATGYSTVTPISGTITSGTLKIARTPNEVFASMTDLKVTSSGNIVIASTSQIPLGYWPADYSTTWVYTTTGRRVMFGTHADSRFIAYGVVAGETLNGVIAAPADPTAPWPTALPS